MKYLYALSLLFLLISNTSFAQANHIQTIRCDADSTQSYSLSLPPNYNKAQKYPVIFLFDPGAQGRTAAGLYPEVAERYGFILCASNNSRNGPISESLNAANAMFTDAFKKYSIDQEQVYLAGFSGGARVATTIGLRSGGIAGIIACGAGFGEPIPDTKLPWIFAGTTGTIDFNYIEMQQTFRQLQASNSVTGLQVFTGTHSWAPAKVFYNALLWCYLQHQKRGADDPLIQRYKALTNELIGASRSLTGQAELYRQYLVVEPDTAYQRKLNILLASIAYVTEKQQADELMKKEIVLQQRIIDAFHMLFSADITQIPTKNWWKTQLFSLNKLLLTHTSADSNYVARQKAFIMGNASESFGQYYAAKRYDTAAGLVEIAEVFDPENPRVYYRRALLAAAEQDGGNTIYYLGQAAKHGFNNKQQIRNEPAFRFLRDDKRFMALLN